MEPMAFSDFIRSYNELFKACNQIYHRLARHYGLSDCAFSILYFLRNEGKPMTQAELCAGLFLSKQTVNSALKKLEFCGQVRLEPAPGQQRNKLVYLTPAGEALIVQTVDPIFRVEESAWSCMAPEAQQTFLELWSEYLKHLQAAADQLIDSTSEEYHPHENHSSC
jgi:DNA-binding MarR family transcriptional regulator